MQHTKKMKLNTVLKGLALFLTTLPVFSYGQLNCPPPGGQEKRDRFHLTLGGGPTLLYGDKDVITTAGAAAQLKFDVRVYKGVLVGLEGQIGSLDELRSANDERFVRNAYRMGALNVTAYPMHFFTEIPRHYSPTFGEKLLHGLYIGVGVGGTLNRYRDIDYGSFLASDSSQYLSGDRNKSLLLPTTNLGISVPLTDAYSGFKKGYWSAVLNGQFSFSRDEDLDGFHPISEDSNKRNDMYSFLSFGIRYSF